MKFTDDELRKALAENGDDLRAAAKALGVTVQAAKNRLSLLGRPRRGPGRPKGVYKKASELKPEDVGRHVLRERRREQIASTAKRHKPALRSRAQQMLRAILVEWGAAGKVALEIGTGTSMVNHLRTGAQPNPSLIVAVEMERKYGIPCVAWMEPPVGEEAVAPKSLSAGSAAADLALARVLWNVTEYGQHLLLHLGSLGEGHAPATSEEWRKWCDDLDAAHTIHFAQILAAWHGSAAEALAPYMLALDVEIEAAAREMDGSVELGGVVEASGRAGRVRGRQR